MVISRLIKIQLAIFGAVSLAAVSVMGFGYLNLPTMIFGAGHYEVTVELPESAGLYPRSNVTYRGSEVGLVKSVQLSGNGVEAVLSLRSDVSIPSELQAAVHSVSAIGEQYVDLTPRGHGSAPLRDGDRIPLADTTVPVDVNTLLDTTNKGLEAVPGEQLKTVIDESYTAVGGLGPELSRMVNASTALAKGARENLDSLTTLIDKSPAVLDSQTQTADSLQSWARNLASVTDQLRNQNDAVSVLLPAGARAANEGRALFDRLQPTIPLLLANLVSISDFALAYHSDIEQLLVLYPANVANIQASGVASETAQKYRGGFLDLALNLNLPPPCQTGFLPTRQARSPALVDSPDRIAGNLYCRVPQDSRWNVRGARNIPCETKPGKRAPTAAMCESDEFYVPLNDGFNWKGDPNATLSGQDVPQMSPAAPPAAAPPSADPAAIATPYDPATGTYVGPDGKVYTQSDLTQKSPETWQSMLVPGE